MNILTSSIIVTPLSDALGAEIGGVDLSREQPQSVIDEIQDAWNTHMMLVFRDQDITMEQQLAFAGRFGPLGLRKRASTKFRHRTEGLYQTNEHTLLVTNMKENGIPIGAFGDADMWFHIDSGYAERPYKGTFLYGMVLPSLGGNTILSNTCKAYDALPQDVKDRIKGLKALHIHEYKRTEKVDLNRDISDSPHFFHPIAITHPENGRKSLFVDRLMTARIEGLPEQEAEELLAYLHDHVERPEFVYEHEWKRHDLIMWDNRSVVHGRGPFPKGEDRLLRRCTVDGGPLHE